MDKYIWAFPVLFIFHDMEEIIWLPGFIKKNRNDIIKRFPPAQKLLSVYKENMTTESFALAVYEELILIIVVCAFVELTEAQWIMGIWYGGLIGFIVHLVIHIIQSVALRRYIPSLVTSILTLPPSILLLIHTKWDMNMHAVIGTMAGAIAVAANLKIAHILMNWYANRSDK